MELLLLCNQNRSGSTLDNANYSYYQQFKEASNPHQTSTSERSGVSIIRPRCTCQVCIYDDVLPSTVKMEYCSKLEYSTQYASHLHVHYVSTSTGQYWSTCTPASSIIYSSISYYAVPGITNVQKTDRTSYLWIRSKTGWQSFRFSIPMTNDPR